MELRHGGHPGRDRASPNSRAADGQQHIAAKAGRHGDRRRLDGRNATGPAHRRGGRKGHVLQAEIGDEVLGDGRARGIGQEAVDILRLQARILYRAQRRLQLQRQRAPVRAAPVGPSRRPDNRRPAVQGCPPWPPLPRFVRPPAMLSPPHRPHHSGGGSPRSGDGRILRVACRPEETQSHVGPFRPDPRTRSGDRRRAAVARRGDPRPVSTGSQASTPNSTPSPPSMPTRRARPPRPRTGRSAPGTGSARCTASPSA